MANVDRPNGARPVSTLTGGSWQGQVRKYAVDASSSVIFPGDFIVLNADGNVDAANAGDLILGVCTGVDVDRTVAATEHPGYLPAASAGSVYVCVGTDIVYEIQEDGNVATAGVVGANGDIVATDGSTTTGVSAHELDSSDVTTKDGTPATGQLRIIAVVDREDNAIANSNARFLVRINEHSFDTAAGV